MILLIIFAFLAGFVTILSPCILPVLPIVLSGSLSGGKKRPIGVVAGFISSFTFFTLLLSTIVRATNISPDLLRNIAVVLILVFGIALIFPQLQVLFEKLASKFSGINTKTKNDDGFFSGMLVGFSLGLIWAPCVGPILASVITLSATSSLTAASVLITLAYSLGTAIPMLIITKSGRKIFTKIPWLLSHTTQIQQMFGVVMIFTALAINFNLDRRFQSYVLTKFPSYGEGLTAIEDNDLVRAELGKLSGEENIMKKNNDSLLFDKGTKAADFTTGGEWINSEPLSLKEELKGKVVLVDFWTYTCINCIRTMPYVTGWHQKYKDQGFEIIGVHSPEFEFEKNIDNVIDATKEFGIEYPVVLDNDFKIWRSYNNRYWPAHYLIDKNGEIRYTHFGEGKYTETENAIRELLDEEPLEDLEEEVSRKRQTPETYLGYQRAGSYTSQNDIEIDKEVDYELIEKLENDAIGLNGSWIVGPESAKATTDGSKLQINFLASKVFLVLTSKNNQSGEVKVKLNGEILPEKFSTKDTDKNGMISVDEDRKYDIVDLKDEYGRNTLELEFSEGVEAFAFTFGS